MKSDHSRVQVTIDELNEFEQEFDQTREWYILSGKTYGEAFCSKFNVTDRQVISAVTDSQIGRDLVRQWIKVIHTNHEI